MSDKAPGAVTYDPNKKINIVDYLSLPQLQNLKGIKATIAHMSPDEFQRKHKIVLPAAIEKAWSQYGTLEFDDFFSEDSCNGHSIVKRFVFSPDGKPVGLYRFLKDLVPNCARQSIESNKNILVACFKVFGEQIEFYEGVQYFEVFYFDIKGTVDSLRVSSTDCERPVAGFIDFLMSHKDDYLSYMRQMELNRIQEIESRKMQHPVLGPYIDRIPECLAGVHHEIEYAEHEWTVHEGDLVIDGNWQADNICLIVTGSLHVRGVYDGYSKGFSFVIVLGDMTADHIVCWYGLGVVGNLTVSGIVNVEHYMFPFEIAGDLRARHISIHSDCCVNWNNAYVETACTHYIDRCNPAEIFKTIAPGLLAKSITEHGLDADFSATVRTLLNGDSPFREAPLGDLVVDKILQYMDGALEITYTQDELVTDMKLDPLLALVISCYQDINEVTVDCLRDCAGFYGEEFDKVVVWVIERLINDPHAVR